MASYCFFEYILYFVFLNRFITSISSLRGAAYHLIGEANLRTDKPLKIPPLEERVFRPALLKQYEELMKKKQALRGDRLGEGSNELQQNSSIYSYSYGSQTSTADESVHEGGLKKLDEQDDYYHIHLQNQQKIKQFASMLNQQGGVLNANAAIVEKAQINPNTAPAPFKYDPTKRRTTSAGKKRGSVAQGNTSDRKGSVLSPIRKASTVGHGVGPDTSSRLSAIRQSVLQPRQSISQPNNSSSTVLSPLKEEQKQGTPNKADVQRKLSTVNSSKALNQRQSILKSGSGALETLHESKAVTSRPTSGRPSSAKPLNSRAQSPLQSNNVKRTNNPNISMASADSIPLERSALTASTSSEVYLTNDGAAMNQTEIAAVLSAAVGKKSEKSSPSHNNKKLSMLPPKKSVSIATPMKGESVFSLQSDSINIAQVHSTVPELRPKSRSTKILDREALTKEVSQSRKVSRMPASKDTITTETGAVVSTHKMTKRKPSSRGDQN